MTRTVICHFYNEEYLLPWWLRHHKLIFDHGIMIDYNSTDKSVDIIKNICPTWTVISSRNESFGAVEIDQEVMDIERSLQNWRMCLNVTEFLTGDINLLQGQQLQQFLIPACALISRNFGQELDEHAHLLDQVSTGVTFVDRFDLRLARSAHNYPVVYPGGRHYHSYNTSDLMICWAGFWPWNNQAIARKTQIAARVPSIDREMGWGIHHLLDFQQQMDWWISDWLPIATPIDQFVAGYQQRLRAALKK